MDRTVGTLRYENWSCGDVVGASPATVTVTATSPDPAGATALRRVLLTTANRAGCAPKSTLVALANPDPVMDTWVPPVVGP
jgi:hypothetical protein